MTKKYKGFTLIELLVVIAIIGILASIVLVSLTTARSRAYDAEIKSELAQLRADAELYYMDSGGTYNGYNVDARTALTPPTCAVNAGTYDTYQDGFLTNDDAYFVYSPLCGSDNHWCVDSTGNSKDVGGTAPAGIYVCP